MTFTTTRWYHRLFRWYGGTYIGALLNRKALPALDRWMFKRSGGQRSVSSIMTGLPVVPVTAIGRKSGEPRTVPLLAIPESDERMLLIASNFGQAKNPVWYGNMTANPQVTLSWPEGDRAYRVEEASGDRREDLWQQAVAAYPGYAQYASRTSRTIPVLVLTPTE